MTTQADDKRKRLAELISQDRLSGQRSAQAHCPAPPRRNSPATADPQAPFPLTPVQESYLIGRSEAFVLGGVSTHNYFEIDLPEVEHARLERAWHRVIQRHGMLRAVFGEQGTQRVLAEVPHHPITFFDHRDTDEQRCERQLAEVRQRMSHQTFKVDQWPLFELTLVRKCGGGCRLHVSMDMLIADALSTMILMRELDLLYTRPEAPLEELTLTFKSYLETMRPGAGSPVYERARGYWESRLESLPPAPELPLAKAPEAISDPRFRRRTFTIDAASWESCRQKLRTAGVTAAAFLAALFALVLARWSKSGHFCLNLTLLNRPPLHPQVNRVVGDFTSLTLLEISVDTQAGVLANTRRVQRQLWRDIEHRHFDGIDVLRLLNRRYANRQAVAMPIVFTSALGLPASGAEQAGTLFPAMSSDVSYGVAQSSQVWLDHVARESGGALSISWDALEELFPEGMLDEMFAAYRDVVTRMSDAAADLQSVLEMPLPEQQRARRASVNATQTELPAGLLHDPFRRRVVCAGERIAVKTTKLALSYHQLNELAEGLAARLSEADAGRSDLIAVVMEKGWEQIAAVLGVLYYGAAYVPVDSSLPPERIELLLEQAHVSVVLTQPEAAATLRARSDRTVIAVTLNEARSQRRGSRMAGPRDMAYVIFTSGSTGVPKGVVIEHQAALNTLVDINRRFSLTPSDKVLAVSSLSFDLSVYDIFGVLGAGGTVVLPDADREKDPSHWVQLVEEEGVTLWSSVPSLLQLLIEQAVHEGESRRLRSLRVALSSGDWLSPDLARRIRERYPDVLLASLGGATEASIWSIIYPIDTAMDGFKSVPYGKPLDNQTFHVLDATLQDRPDWVAGELYIGGAGLARQYWQDDQKTRDAFIVRPQSGERLYRTGDLGRYLGDGNIEFLGRNDSQVKIRGNRVELGEIEATLRLAEGIKDAVVLADGDKFGRKRLVAYLVYDLACHEAPGGRESSGTEPVVTALDPDRLGRLRGHLLQAVPDYMIPAVFVTLERIPLTANGKPDRARLPPVGAGDGQKHQYVAPETPLQRELAAGWQEVLGVERVGIHDNFFEIGGDSLAAIRLLALIRRRIAAGGAQLSLKALLGSPTVQQLADAIQLNAQALIVAEARQQVLGGALAVVEGEL